MGPRENLPPPRFGRITISYTGVVGSALNVRYIGPDEGGPVEDFSQRVDMTVGEFGASRYILSIFNTDSSVKLREWIL